MDDDELKAIEARADAATVGPWHHDNTTLWACVTSKPGGFGGAIAQSVPINDPQRERANAAFIAAARTDVPALAAALREAWAALARVEGDFRHAHDVCVTALEERDTARAELARVTAERDALRAEVQRLTAERAELAERVREACAERCRRVADESDVSRVEAFDARGGLSPVTDRYAGMCDGAERCESAIRCLDLAAIVGGGR